MLQQAPELLAILRPRTYEQYLLGFCGGIFSPERTKFMAHTYVRLDAIDHEEYSFALNSFGSYSSAGVDGEERRIHLDMQSYQMKSMEECIEQGIYLAYAVKFTGVLYEQEWFVQSNLTFFGEQMNEEKAKAYLIWGYDDPGCWSQGVFGEDWPPQMPGFDPPLRYIEHEEFPGMPWLVRETKIEQKNAVNRAFVQYMNVWQVFPFLQRMRIRFPDEFTEFNSLFGENYQLLFPQSKTCFLVVTMARQQALGFRLAWFFYEPVAAKFYRWTYPQPRYSEWSYHYPEDVITDIEDISDWNDTGFLNSSRTMDDPRFWSEYVLKMENGSYRWLEQINGE